MKTDNVHSNGYTDVIWRFRCSANPSGNSTIVYCSSGTLLSLTMFFEESKRLLLEASPNQDLILRKLYAGRWRSVGTCHLLTLALHYMRNRCKSDLHPPRSLVRTSPWWTARKRHFELGGGLRSGWYECEDIWPSSVKTRMRGFCQRVSRTTSCSSCVIPNPVVQHKIICTCVQINIYKRTIGSRKWYLIFFISSNKIKPKKPAMHNEHL